jgi:hypothetical protein
LAHTYPRGAIASNVTNTGSFTWALPPLFNVAQWQAAGR